MPKRKQMIRVQHDGVEDYFNFTSRKDGRKVVRIRIGEMPDGVTPKYKNIYGTTVLDLQVAVAEYFKELTEKQESKEIFTNDILRWLKEKYWGEVEPSTYDRYEQTIRNQIIFEANKLEHKKVREITTQDCLTILNNVKKQFSSSTYKKAKTLLNSYFEDKVYYDELAKNPVKIREVHSRKNKRLSSIAIDKEDNDVVYLSEEEINKVKDVIKNCDFVSKSRTGNIYINHCTLFQSEIFLFMMNTGLRAGEMCALKYSDINFDNQIMTVRNNATYVRRRDDNGERLTGLVRHEGDPKTIESKSTVLLNKPAYDILVKMKSGEPDDYDGYILYNKNTREPLSTNALRKRWYNVCNQAGIPTRGLHSLRHTCATMAFAMTDGDVVFVSKLLRHSSVSITEDIYIKIIEKYREKRTRMFSI